MHGMDAEQELPGRVRALREKGLSPKEIARALGMPRAKVTSLIKAAAAAEPTDPAERAVVECWVSSGWREGLSVAGHVDWPDELEGDPEKSGVALVLVVRDAGRGRVSVCGYLVDVYCLGVKNTLGPEVMDHHALPAFVRNYFSVFDRPPLRAPLELAQHLVFGAVEYARGLGFEPVADSGFDRTESHLGQWEGPSAIEFGNNGKPYFVCGPRDNPDRILKTLRRSVGEGNFDYLIGVPA